MDPNREKMRSEYTYRINRVMDYIERNLSDELSLENLAGVANFSPYHFHRIFRAMAGETLFGFILRLRVERAAQLLVSCDKPVTAIALDCGFSGSAAFARSFRDAYGMSPTQWRALKKSNVRTAESKECMVKSNSRQDMNYSVVYIEANTVQQRWRIKMIEGNEVTIQVREMPAYPVVYVRHVGPYQGDEELFRKLFAKLFRWAAPRGLLNDPDAKLICVYHDDPGLTDGSKLRTSICLTVPEGTPGGGDIGTMTIEGGKYAVGHFEINADQFGAAWDMMCGGWMSESGYQPDDRLSYEVSLNDPRDHPDGKHVVEICVPVRPL